MLNDELFTDCVFKGEVILTDTTPECVRAMLEFFYTGMVSDDKMKIHVDGIFVISHKYQVEMLKYLCERFMSCNIVLVRRG
uniref:BTB domain-containing protein n=1 Tax=Meloidogyne incognita TaxID=6306 RepID=A0A914N9T6_MELIC